MLRTSGQSIDILNKDCRRSISISAILTWVPENVKLYLLPLAHTLLRVKCRYMSLVCINVTQFFFQSCSFFSIRFFSRAANLSSGMNDIHTTRQVCRPAEKMAGKKTTRQKKNLVTFIQTRDMYLHFTRSNIWANGNN